MSCVHRFSEELIPQWEIKYLFIGTFNPSWNPRDPKNPEAVYFYGRNRNNFWAIIPNIFGGRSLKGMSKDVLVEYTKSKKIGITDIINSVINADATSSTDVDNLTKGFSDAVLNKYDLEFSTDLIIELIEKNKSTLEGVYFTRSTSNGINKIWKEWLKIEKLCIEYSIKSAALITPANYKGGVERKTIIWEKFIS